MTEVFNLFDKFTIESCEELSYFFDGQVGKRVLFIQNQSKDYLVSFEEGMECFDLKDCSSQPMVESEFASDGKYIHQKRTVPQNRADEGTFAFFHIELTDDSGEKVILPGQMVIEKGFQWSDGVEPVLLELLDGIAVCKTKGGGDD